MKKKYARRVANYNILIGILLMYGNSIEFEGISVVFLSIAFVILGLLTKYNIKKNKPFNIYFIPLIIIWLIFIPLVFISLIFGDFLLFFGTLTFIAFPFYNSVKYYLAKDNLDNTELPI